MSDAQHSASTALQQAVDTSSLWLLFALAGGGGASLLAIGLLLRGSRQITWRVVVGTALHSLVWGVCVFLLTVDHNTLGLPFTVGLSIFSGMGAASFVDVMRLVVQKRIGLSLTFNSNAKEP